MTLEINELQITLKYSFRALIIFEEITGKSMTVPETLKDIMIFFYSIILSSAKGELQNWTWDDFVDYLDDNPDKIIEFTTWLKAVLETQNQITEKHSKEVESKSPKKVRSTRSKTV